MAYATVTELRNQANIQSEGATLLEILGDFLDTASDLIDTFCGRPDGFVADESASARYYTTEAAGHLEIDECVAVSEVAVKDSYTETDFDTWTAPTTAFAGDGDYILCTGSIGNPEFNRVPYTLIIMDPNGDHSEFPDGRGRPVAKITARWGYAETVPNQIKEAAIMQATRWYQRMQGMMADVVASADMGQLRYRRVLDPDVELLLDRGRFVVPQIGR